MRQFFLKSQVAVMVIVFFSIKTAHAQIHADYSTIARNINTSLQDVPELISGIAYLLGLLYAVLGIFKLKDHVDNPKDNNLNVGAAQLAVGGALLALPVVLEAMQATIGYTSYEVRPATLIRVGWNVQ